MKSPAIFSYKAAAPELAPKGERTRQAQTSLRERTIARIRVLDVRLPPVPIPARWPKFPPAGAAPVKKSFGAVAEVVAPRAIFRDFDTDTEFEDGLP